jgi:hypothetical protein
MRHPRLVLLLLAHAFAGLGLCSPDAPSNTSGPARERGTAVAREMIAAAGGMERWNAIRDASFVLRTTAFEAGPTGSVVTSIQAEFTKAPRPTLRVDVPHGKGTQTKVFDGLEAWMAVDGVLLPRGESTYQRIRNSARMYFLWIAFPFNLLDPGTTVEHLGTGHVAGEEVDLLQVRFGEQSGTVSPEDLRRFAVSRRTHLTLKEEYFLRGENENKVETTYGDYREVGGILKDHLREIVSSVDGRTLQRIEVHDLAFGEHVARDRFRKPPGPPPAEPSRE